MSTQPPCPLLVLCHSFEALVTSKEPDYMNLQALDSLINMFENDLLAVVLVFLV